MRRPVTGAGADDDADRPVEVDVVPRPAHQHLQPVLEPDQVVEVDDEPHDPADEAGERERSDLSDRRACGRSSRASPCRGTGTAAAPDRRRISRATNRPACIAGGDSIGSTSPRGPSPAATSPIA